MKDFQRVYWFYTILQTKTKTKINLKITINPFNNTFLWKKLSSYNKIKNEKGGIAFFTFPQISLMLG